MNIPFQASMQSDRYDTQSALLSSEMQELVKKVCCARRIYADWERQLVQRVQNISLETTALVSFSEFYTRARFAQSLSTAHSMHER